MLTVIGKVICWYRGKHKWYHSNHETKCSMCGIQAVVWRM